MSRSLVLLALLPILVFGIAPILVMTGRASASDLAQLLDARTLSLLWRTCLLGGGAGVLAFVLGLPFGFLTHRTDMPGRAALRAVGVVPLLLPPLVLAMTWTMLVDLRGAPMTILLLGAGTFPLVALFAGRAFERIDARREEAALLVGGLPAVLRMELPLVLPGALAGTALAFVFAINDFAVPDFVSSVGPKFNVYADEVFASWQIERAEGRAIVTALPLVLLTLAALLPVLALRRRGAFATVDADFRSPAPLALGPWRMPALVACLALVTLAAFVPIGRLVYEAGGGTRGFNFGAMRAAFARALELCRPNLVASLGYAVSTATLSLPVALVIGHALERARHGRKLEPLVVLPIAVPAVLFGIGNIALWNNGTTGNFYASGGMVVAMLLGRFVVFPILIFSGAVAALDPRLEEAAELAGARPSARLMRVVAPCLWPSLVGGWTLVFVLAMRELDAAILVPAANKTVMFRIFNAVHFGRDDFVAALALMTVFVILLPGLLWTLFGRRRLEVLP